MKTIDVTIWNGRIKMQTTTIRGSAANIAKISREVKSGTRYDVAGTKIKVGHFETAGKFNKAFGIK